MKPLEGLSVAIFGDSPCNPIQQFLAVDLHPLCLTFRLLVIEHIHWHPLLLIRRPA
jgi:hypothetical protein